MVLVLLPVFHRQLQSCSCRSCSHCCLLCHKSKSSSGLSSKNWILRRNRLSNVVAACILTEMSQISNCSDTNCWILRRRNRLSNVVSACILTETSQISNCSDTNCWL